MAEAVAVVGAIAACSQLAKYGTGLAKSLLNSTSDLQAIPKIIEELFERLDWHIGMMRSLTADASNPAGQPSIKPILRASIRAASSLQQLLTPLVVHGKQTKAKKLRRMLSYQKRIRKIERCQTDLESCERQLVLHFVIENYCNTHSFINNDRSTGAGHKWSPPVVPLSRTPTFSILQTSAMSPSGLFGIPNRSKFIGRDLTMCALSQILTEAGRKACLVGLEGIGKSEIAKECAYRIHDLHSSIFVLWVQASDRLVFERSLIQLFRDVGVITDTNPQEISPLKLIEKLDSAWSCRWLLVVDDIHGNPDGDSVAHQFASIPIKYGSILFTTRDIYTAVSLVENRFAFAVDAMEVDEAFEMLQSRVSSNSLSDKEAYELVEYLEYHPRAIAKAAESMGAHGISALEYLQILERQEEQCTTLLGQPYSAYTELPDTTTLITSDTICMERLWEQDRAAAHFLAVVACLSRAKIPLNLFKTTYDSMQLARVLAVLRGFSLITICKPGSTVMVPRLVRLSVRVYLRRLQRTPIYAFHALRTIARAFPEDNKQYSMLPESGSYLPHALAIIMEYCRVPAASHSPTAQATNSCLLETDRPVPYFEVFSCHNVDEVETMIPFDYVGPLALRVSHFLCVLGQYSKAMEIATKTSRWSFGISPTEILACVASITSLFRYLGHPVLFASQIERIYTSQTILIKSHRPLTIRVLGSKGLALQAQGHYAQAEGYHRRAIAICRSTYGQQDTRLRDEEHGLALSILGQNRSQEALEILYDIYNHMEAVSSPKNPKILSVLANIGCALQQLCRWTDAYHVLSCALSGRKDVLGEDHPHTIQNRANLAQIHVANGDYAAAEDITRETLRIHVEKLGEDHYLSLHMMNNLGYLLFGQERFAEAAETLHCVARKREAILGPEHCDTLNSLFYASKAYRKMERFDEALLLRNKVPQARQSLDDDDDAGRGEIEDRMDEIDRDRQLVR